MKTILLCFGTRPEAIKVAPLVLELQRRSGFRPVVCVTAQHREMLDQVLEIFEIVPDHDLDVMTPGQSLERLTARIIESMGSILDEVQPDCVIVQGDTTTTFVSALAAFYRRIPVAHVEAGLRTQERYSPFPEEINRRMTSALTQWHFPPTQRARDSLLEEAYDPATVHVVGNTVIDALMSVLPKARARARELLPELADLDPERRMILVTGHRRESFGPGFERICKGIRQLASAHPDVEIVYPVHLNPNVTTPVQNILGGIENVRLLRPQPYLAFVALMDRAHFVLTDSGGIQEEAPSLGKPVLVMRDTTERPEAVDAGVARLVGTDEQAIFENADLLLRDPATYQRMSQGSNPYGAGDSSQQIIDILEKELTHA